MSHKAGIAQPLISNKTIIIVLAICFSLLALTILHSLNGEEQNSKKEEGGQKERVANQFKELQLPLNFKSFHVPVGRHQFKFLLKKELSGRIFIPPGHSVTVDATYADIYFHGDKEPLRIRSGEAVEGGTHPSHSTFKICGEGEVEISVQPTP